MNALVSFEYLAVSPSSRRAWIEIPVFPEQTTRNKVALLAEGVDRNMGEVEDTPWMPTVALLAEGVDRNSLGNCGLPTLPRSPSSRRAWIEIFHHETHIFLLLSPSSRRAWIEMWITSA